MSIDAIQESDFSSEFLRQKNPEELFDILDTLEKSQNKGMIKQVFDEISKRGLSLDVIEPLLLKRTWKLIDPLEKSFLTGLRKHLPHLNKALISYELLERQTRKMDLSEFTRTQVTVKGVDYQIYDAKDVDYQFLVHSAQLVEKDPYQAIEEKNKKEFLCASVVSPEAHFYRPSKSYGIILACDPRCLVTATREDGWTPYSEGTPVQQFYNFYQRLQVFTSYVDQLYRESGLQGEHPTDDLSRFNRLASMHDLDKETGKAIADLKKQLKYTAPFYGYDECYTNSVYSDYKDGITIHQLKALAIHYKDTPEKLRIIERCRTIIEGIRSNEIYKYYIQPIQGPQEIARQTPSQSQRDSYNEINIDLSREYKPNQIEVKGIFISRETFDNNPEIFAELFEIAKEKNLPIILKGPLFSPLPAEFLKRSVELGLSSFPGFLDTIAEFLQKNVGKISVEEAGIALVIACSGLHDIKVRIVQNLLKYYPNIEQTFLQEALHLAVENNESEVEKLILDHAPELREKALASPKNNNSVKEYT